MLAGLLSLISAVTFAYANASMRRGVLTGTVLQAVAVSLSVGIPLFILVMLLFGGFSLLSTLSGTAVGLLALSGVIHFALQGIAIIAQPKLWANLVAPVQQYGLVIYLLLAVFWLGDSLTALRIVGIILVVVGPAITLRNDPQGGSTTANEFQPSLSDGYLFAFLSALGFGVSPI